MLFETASPLPEAAPSTAPSAPSPREETPPPANFFGTPCGKHRARAAD